MREMLTSEQAALLQRLFASAERWGWEYREPEALPAIFPHPRPALHVPWPDWAAQATPKLEAAERRKAWEKILTASADEVFTIGTVNGIRQPALTWIA